MNKYTIAIVAILLSAGQVSAQEAQTSATSSSTTAPRPIRQEMIRNAGEANKAIRQRK